MGGGIWSIAVIIGPLLLLGAIIYAFVRSRSGWARTTERGVRGAERLRDEIERGDPPPQS